MPGVTFTWSRAAVTGIYEHASAGVDNPNEQLLNTTYAPVVVSYVYTLTSLEGCTNTQTVAVTVNPSIKLNSAINAPGICSGDVFNYTPTSLTAGATFAWSRTTLTGITPYTSSGSGNIGEALTNANPTPTVVAYKYKLSANGCLAKTPEYVYVSVYSVPCKLAVPTQNTVGESRVYPNPNTGAFTVFIATVTNEKAALTITNLVGTKVIEQQIETNTTTDISLDVPAGIYMLSAATATDKYFHKVVVTK